MGRRRHVNVTFRKIASVNPKTLQEHQKASIQSSNYVYAWSFWLPRTCCRACTMSSGVDFKTPQKVTKKNRSQNDLYMAQKPLKYDLKEQSAESPKAPLEKKKPQSKKILNPIEECSSDSVQIKHVNKDGPSRKDSHYISNLSNTKKLDSSKDVFSVNAQNQIKKKPSSISKSITPSETVPKRLKPSKYAPCLKSNYQKSLPLAIPKRLKPSKNTPCSKSNSQKSLPLTIPKRFKSSNYTQCSKSNYQKSLPLTIPKRLKPSKYTQCLKSNYQKNLPSTILQHNLPNRRLPIELTYHYEMPTICSLCYYSDPEAFCFHALNRRTFY